MILLNYSVILPFVKLRKQYQSDLTLLQCFTHSTEERTYEKRKGGKNPSCIKTYIILQWCLNYLKLLPLCSYEPCGLKRILFTLKLNGMSTLDLLILTGPFGNNHQKCHGKTTTSWPARGSFTPPASIFSPSFNVFVDWQCGTVLERDTCSTLKKIYSC